MNDKQKLAIRCAHLDLNHALKAHEFGFYVDWEDIRQSIIDLEDAFDFLNQS